jgi:CheY-like chemotaxis protein
MTPSRPPAPFRVVVLAASAGGLGPLRGILAALPADLGAAVLVVMHLDPACPSRLASILDREGPLPAVHPRDRDALRLGRVYVAPPDRHLTVSRRFVRVSQGSPENYVRPSADVLFRSAADAFGPSVIGVVLSGSGRDGAAGLAAVRAAGGVAIVQEPGDASVASMPRHALAAAKPDHCVPAARIVPLLVRLVRAPPRARPGDTRQPRPRLAPLASLRRLRVLVVEDRYLIATEIARMLRDLGCQPVGPAPDVSAGLRMVARDPGPLGCAVLDVDLRGEGVYPLASELRRRGVPILFATGYDHWSLPAEWHGTPRIGKPFAAAQLTVGLRLALATAPAPAPPAAAPHGDRDEVAELLKESRNLVMASRVISREP